MAPVIHALNGQTFARVRVLVTGQHRDILDQMLGLFGIEPDIDLDLMQENQTLPQLTSRLASRLDEVLSAEKPDMVLVQGDTTTVMMTAMICFYKQIPLGHVEAGLRTGNRHSPFPEEMNRYITGYLSDLHFAPTQSSRTNLLKEGVPDHAITVTGNTVIDALLYMVAKGKNPTLPVKDKRRLILVTAHRRENFGEPFKEICRAIRDIAMRHEDVEILYPVHPNPNVREVAQELLAGGPRITLCDPLDYASFVSAMTSSFLIITDSGGVQEEAPALGIPVLVLRNETERPEAVDAGVVKLVGSSYGAILSQTERLLTDAAAYQSMAKGVSPYGDGKAAGRIVAAIQNFLGERACS